MRIRSAVAVMLLLTDLAACASRPPPDSPGAAVAALYAAHQPWKNRSVDLADPAALRRHFDPGLAELLARAAAQDNRVLDFDPVLDAQDFGDWPDGLPLTLTDLSAPGRVLWRASFPLFPGRTRAEDRRVDYELVRTGDGWRIHDMLHHHGDRVSSLRTVLAAARNEAAPPDRK
ncbi:MAG: hypothetical protein U1F77_20145 [Kiritimatiellia bacterium]